MRRSLLFLSLLLLTGSLLSMGGCAVFKSRTVREVVKLAKEDGDRVLQEPMRPIRGGTRVLIFALDGVGRDDFMGAVRAGHLPRIGALLGAETQEAGTFAHGCAASNVLSILPSSTTAAWTSIFTGKPPGETGVPGNEWYDRNAMRFHAPSPVTTERRYQVLGAYNEDRLGDLIRVPTLFEQTPLRAHVSLLPVYRGADMINVPEIEPFGTLFNAAVKNAVGVDSAMFKLYEKVDKVSIKSIEESLHRYGIADVQTVYFPGIDLFTHVAPSPVESQRRYLARVVDDAVGDVLDLYRKAGVLDQTYVVFVSDHGHTEVLPKAENALWREGVHEPPVVLDTLGFRVRPWGLKVEDNVNDFQAVLAYQGGLAYVYLADRSTCETPGTPCDWRRSPRLEEDVLPVVRAFDAANRTGAYVPALKGTLDLIFARAGAGPDRENPPFKVFDGERLVSVEDYLKKHPRPDLLALDRRLRDLAVGPQGYLAGDVLLLSRMRLDEPVAERTYFGDAYHSWHGSPNRQDSEVVFVVAHPRKDGRALTREACGTLGPHPSHMDMTPLVLELLNR